MKIERKLSNKKMTEGKTRNVILVIAIALTTVMFTVLMTIFSSISEWFDIICDDKVYFG